MSITYNARAQCLRAIAGVLACYGFEERSKEIWSTAYDPENLGPSMSGHEVGRMLDEEGLECRLMAFEPRTFDMLNEQPQCANRPVLLQVKGVGGQNERFFVIGAFNYHLGANIYLNLPRGFDIEECPPREELFTGVMVVPADCPPSIQDEIGRLMPN